MRLFFHVQSFATMRLLRHAFSCPIRQFSCANLTLWILSSTKQNMFLMLHETDPSSLIFDEAEPSTKCIALMESLLALKMLSLETLSSLWRCWFHPSPISLFSRELSFCLHLLAWGRHSRCFTAVILSIAPLSTLDLLSLVAICQST